MIVNYAYCGISECQNGSKRIWGAATWADKNGYTDTYIFWGTPDNPLIKKYIYHSGTPKSRRLLGRIREKQKTWSGYKEIKSEDVKNVLPDIESQIGMHILAKELKYAGNR
jgi:hypothetical protein